jgi:CubicO group peptidase (beta-lactamase class C family)
MPKNQSVFFILSLSILVLFTNIGYAQPAVIHAPEKAGISLERLDRYTQFLKSEVSSGNMAGAVSLVSRRGEIVHHEAIGFNSLSGDVRMSNDHIFSIQSMTKPIISVGFMMLYEEGHFLLTDRVSKYIPEFKDLKVAVDVDAGIDGATVPIESEVRIHHLLSHTAGFSHGLGGNALEQAIAKSLYNTPHENIKSRVMALLSMPLISQPGKQWYYSASPDVLALLIEQFSGQSPAEFLQHRIFDPLEMNNTGYNVSVENQDRLVKVHAFDKEGKLFTSPNQSPPEDITVFGGTHGLYTTAADYLKFCNMLLNKGTWNGQVLLSPKTIELMTMDHVGGLYQAPGQGFGLGFAVVTDVSDARSLGSSGQYYWNGMFRTHFFIDPEEELIAILLTQTYPYSNYYADKMRQMVYQSIID